MAKLTVLGVLLLVIALVRADVWTDLVLKFQRDAAVTEPLDRLSLPCAHNAYNNPKNLPKNLIDYENLILFKGKIIIENQELTMTQLLNMGIRHLQIDAHYIAKYNQTWMCHGAPEAASLCPFVESATGDTCSNVINMEDLGDHTGCTKDAVSWENGIIEIANWIASHPTEFVIVEVEDDASGVPGSNETQFAGPMVRYLGPYLVTAAELDAVRTATGKAWPSITDLRTHVNKSVILTGVDRTFASIIPYIIDTNSSLPYPQNQEKNFSPSNCNNVAPTFAFVTESGLKVQIDILGFNISESGKDTVGQFDSATYPKVFGCGFSACSDRIVATNVANYVWSWSGNSSQITCQPNMCPAIVNGVWSHVSCSQNNRAACQSLTNPTTWVLSTASTAFASASCPNGFTFAYPHIPYYNSALKTVAGSATVWLNVNTTYNPSHPVCSYIPQNSAAISSFSLSFLPLAFAIFLSLLASLRS